MNKIPHIEGLRAYLALWVLFDHVMGASYYEMGDLPWILQIVRSGTLAVSVFIIISGFVIFSLLDQNKESYGRFIIRRFFRLWPLFILLFLASIPLSLLHISNCQQFENLHPELLSKSIVTVTSINSWFDYGIFHLIFHIPMLHGVVPDSVLPSSSVAFLGPAWSISLEWQFYLLAPWVVHYLARQPKSATLAISLGCLLIYMLSHQLVALQSHGFIGMHIQYFFFGCVSYFIYKFFKNHTNRINTGLMPLAFVFSSFVFLLSEKTFTIIPVAIWIVFLSLLIDLIEINPDRLTKITAWFFNNKLVLHLGKISYSIYLSHYLIIIIIQFVLIKNSPLLSQKNHAITLTIVTVVSTVLISHLLYTFVELPGINFGRSIANRFGKKSPIKRVQ